MGVLFYEPRGNPRGAIATVLATMLARWASDHALALEAASTEADFRSPTRGIRKEHGRTAARSW